jgi:hypothetical protein
VLAHYDNISTLSVTVVKVKPCQIPFFHRRAMKNYSKTYFSQNNKFLAHHLKIYSRNIGVVDAGGLGRTR